MSVNVSNFTTLTSPQSILSNAIITSNGTETIIGNFSALTFTINILTVSIGASLQFTVQDVDPGNQSTLINSNTSSITITSPGTYSLTLNPSYSNISQLTWTIAGTNPKITAYVNVYPSGRSIATTATQIIKKNETVSANSSPIHSQFINSQIDVFFNLPKVSYSLQASVAATDANGKTLDANISSTLIIDNNVSLLTFNSGPYSYFQVSYSFTGSTVNSAFITALIKNFYTVDEPLSGDLSNNYPNPTVIAIQGNAIQAQSLGVPQDQYVLTWVNADHRWEAQPATGGGGGFIAGGDLSGSSVSQTVAKLQGSILSAPLSSGSANKVLHGDSSGTLNWSNIVNADVDNSAAISYAKLNLTGSIINTDISSSASISYSKLNLTSSIVNGDISSSAAIIVSKLASGTAGQFLVNTSTPTPTWTTISGDVSASVSTAGLLTITKIQNNAVQSGINGASQDGYVLTWINADNQYEVKPSSSSSPTGSAGGDLSGTYPNPTVAKINGTSVSVSPSNNQVLVATGSTTSTWQQIVNAQIDPAAAIAYSKLNLTGDIVNADINGSAAIAVSKLVAGTSTQILLNNATPTPTWTTVGGDATINATGSITVSKINSASVPAAGSLTTGNVLQVSGSSALSYGAVNLGGGAGYITGTLPAGNQASQSMGGDVSGTTAASTVIKIQGNAVKAETEGATQDGYVLTWVNGNNEWEAKPAAGGGSPTGSAGGDLSGTYPNPTVAKIKNYLVATQTLNSSVDGYILTWDNSDGYWKAAKPTIFQTDIPLTAGVFSTSLNQFQRVGGREMDFSKYPATIGALNRRVDFYATINSTSGSVTASVQLFDETNNVLITGTLLTTTLTTPTTFFATNLTVGTSSGNLRTDVISQYQVQIEATGSSGVDQAIISNGRLIVSYF